MDDAKKYGARGVSANKSDVHKAIKHLDKGLYPNAFCKIIEDVVGAHPDFCNIMHADTAGTKTSLAYLAWKELNQIKYWKGIAQDALVMNIDDMACAGALDKLVISSTIGRNYHLIPSEVIQEVIHSTDALCKMLTTHGIQVTSSGGETADVGDVVRTIDVGITAFARLPRKEVQDINIEAGQLIVGLASSGQASYENAYNSGIGSNGLTSARHDVLSSYYATNYPESYSPETDPSVIFTGSKRLSDSYAAADGNTYLVADLLLSPTRTYLPVMKAIQAKKIQPAGIIHCTGGAQTKVLKFCTNCTIIKDQLLDVPPVFRMIQSESNTSWKEMFQVFNMGHRLEYYVNSEAEAKEIIACAQAFDIDAQIIGHVEPASQHSMEIIFEGESYFYS